MSTRACYRFIEPDLKSAIAGGIVTVYKHHDGYPIGALKAIKNALALAWPLPRFEADEFAAAFVAANKPGPGGVRLVALTGAEAFREFATDIDYLYDITTEQRDLIVAAYSASERDGAWAITQLFRGPLDRMIENQPA